MCFFKYTSEFPKFPKKYIFKNETLFFPVDIVDEETFERGCANSEEMFAGEKDKVNNKLNFIPNGSVSKIRNRLPVRELRPIRGGEPRLRVRLHQLQRGAGAGEEGLVFLGLRGGRAGHRRGRPWNVEKER